MAEAEAFKGMTERLSGHRDESPYRQREVEGLQKATSRRIWAQVREKPRRADQGLDTLGGAAIGAIDLRYEGGLPGVPPNTEVKVNVGGAVLRLNETRSGAALAQAPLIHLLGVQAFPSNSSLLNGWVGMTFGGATYLTSPTFPGGSLVIVNAQAGRPMQWGLGNRSGLFTRKADYTGFCMMRDGLAAGASMAARWRLAAGDPRKYAEELGFRVAGDAPSAALPRRRDETPTEPQSARGGSPMDGTKVCPDCAETVKAAAKICRYCRHDFGPESGSQ